MNAFDVNYREDVLPLDTSSLISLVQSPSGSTWLGLLTFCKQVWSRTWLLSSVWSFFVCFNRFFVCVRVNNLNLDRNIVWTWMLGLLWMYICVLLVLMLLCTSVHDLWIYYVLPGRFEYFRQKVKVHKYFFLYYLRCRYIVQNTLISVLCVCVCVCVPVLCTHCLSDPKPKDV